MNPERQLGEQGLSEAMDRLRQRLNGPGWYRGPFTEALWWITALKDIDDRGQRLIDYECIEGQTLKALGWARNYPTHELLTVLMTIGGTLPAMLPMVLAPGIAVWKGEADLPPSDREGREGRDPRRDVYESLVARRGVLQPLDLAQGYLVNLP
jgi:hypothetical protein